MQISEQEDTNPEETKTAIAAGKKMYFQAFIKGDSSLCTVMQRTCWITEVKCTLRGMEAPADFFRNSL